MTPAPLPGEQGQVPAAINPVTGTVTDLLPPGLSFLGTEFDIVTSGNTIYVVSNMFSTFLQEVNATTGAAQSIPLSSPVTDMTVNPLSGNLFGMTPAPLPGELGQVPAAINPVTGTVTDLLPPGLSFLGTEFDIVASGNTLYVVSDTLDGTASPRKAYSSRGVDS